MPDFTLLVSEYNNDLMAFLEDNKDLDFLEIFTHLTNKFYDRCLYAGKDGDIESMIVNSERGIECRAIVLSLYSSEV